MSIMPLDDFFENIAHNHWWGWQLGSPKMPTGSCDAYVRQQAWQNAKAVGRDDIIKSIEWAEGKLTTRLGFSPGPVLTTETIRLGCWWHYDWQKMGCYEPGQLKVGLGKVQQVGSYTWQLIGVTADLTSSDPDGDTLKELFTATIADSTTDPADAAIFFQASDIYKAGDNQIRPVTITRKDPNTLQVQGPMWLLVKPAKYFGAKLYPGFDPDISGTDSSGAIPLEDPTVYVSQVAFYKRVWTGLNQATLTFNQAGTLTTKTMTAIPAFNEEGILYLQGQVPCTCLGFSNFGIGFPASAASITISYLSGDNLDDWKLAITRLALANLNRFICGCDSPEWWQWQRDRSNIGGPTADIFKITEQDLANPFGPKAGAIFAWHQVLEKRLLNGLAI